MDINSILEELQLGSLKNYKEIIAGEDSSVWKLENAEGDIFALRLLPIERYRQFEREEEYMRVARQGGVPVPKVHFVKKIGDWSAMLMDWAEGRTVLEEILAHPETAYKLGTEFGKTQASIHKISLITNEIENWLSPQGKELDLFHQLREETQTQMLLHLDYHPLNVLTDGTSITAVIDWANACVDDPRFDTARTFAILDMEVKKAIQGSQLEEGHVKEFINGWVHGYGKMPEDYPQYNRWAGLRMIRDLAGKRSAEELIDIEQWATRWEKYDRTR